MADIYVQPLRLGWRRPHFDLVTGYAFYVPTGSIVPDVGPTGVSRAQWTHQISFGGTVYFDQRRSWQLSLALPLGRREIPTVPTIPVDSAAWPGPR